MEPWPEIREGSMERKNGSIVRVQQVMHASQLWREAQSWNHGLILERGVWRGRMGAL